MFLCEKCLDKCEGPAVSYAKTMVSVGFGSKGPCESCKKVSICADIPSSANWNFKKES